MKKENIWRVSFVMMSLALTAAGTSSTYAFDFFGDLRPSPAENPEEKGCPDLSGSWEGICSIQSEGGPAKEENDALVISQTSCIGLEIKSKEHIEEIRIGAFKNENTQIKQAALLKQAGASGEQKIVSCFPTTI